MPYGWTKAQRHEVEGYEPITVWWLNLGKQAIAQVYKRNGDPQYYIIMMTSFRDMKQSPGSDDTLAEAKRRAENEVVWLMRDALKRG